MVTRSPRRISLHFAVADIQLALNGIRILVDACAADSLSGSDTPRSGAEAAAALLSILSTHAENLLRVTRGEADARVILTAGNTAPDEPLQDCQDLVVPVWEARKAFEHAKTKGAAVPTDVIAAKPKRRRGRR